jgi:hypothetical protein
MFRNKIFVIVSLFMGCSPQPVSLTVSTPEKSSSSVTSDGNQTKSTTGTGKKKPTASKEVDNMVPDYDQANLSAGFNKADPRAQSKADPNNAGKVFKIQRIGYYRTIFADMREEFWQGTIADTAGVFGAQSFLKYKGDPSAMRAISIYQPMLEMVTDDDYENNVKYNVIGNAVEKGVDSPSFPTAVLAITDLKAYADAIIAPDDYKMIYAHQGPDLSKMLEYCDQVSMTAQLNPEKPMPRSDQTFCDNFVNGVTDLGGTTYAGASGGTYTIDKYANPTAAKLDSFMTRRSVYVWRPIPPTGYRCLGDIATNTSEKPSSLIEIRGTSLNGSSVNRAYQGASDLTKILGGGEDAQKAAQNYTNTYDSPVVCIKETYLTAGKLREFARDEDRKVVFYTITPQDASGYGEANVFYTIAESKETGKTVDIVTQEKATTVWVLKKQILRLLKDMAR